MICVHRLNKQQMYINAAHIVAVEPTPDTLLHLMDGTKLMVTEPCQEVCAMITRWFQEVGRVTVLPFNKPPAAGENADEGA